MTDSIMTSNERAVLSKISSHTGFFLGLVVLLGSILAVFPIAHHFVNQSNESLIAARGLALLVEIAVVILTAKIFLLRLLFKNRKGGRLASTEDLKGIQKQVWLWALYAFALQILVNIIFALIKVESNLLVVFGPMIGCRLATQIIAYRLVKQGKAHVELNS